MDNYSSKIKTGDNIIPMVRLCIACDSSCGENCIGGCMGSCDYTCSGTCWKGCMFICGKQVAL